MNKNERFYLVQLGGKYPNLSGLLPLLGMVAAHGHLLASYVQVFVHSPFHFLTCYQDSLRADKHFLAGVNWRIMNIHPPPTKDG